MSEWINKGDVSYLTWGGCLVKKDDEIKSSDSYYVFRLHTPADLGEEDTYLARLYYVDVTKDLVEKLEVAGAEIDGLSGEDIAVELVEYGICDSYSTYKSNYPAPLEYEKIARAEVIDYMKALDIKGFVEEE